MKLQSVSKEQAIRLRDVGFPQDKHDLGYTICKCSDRFNVYEEGTLTENASSMIKKVSAPSLELAAKWLREEHDIDISIDVGTKEERYKYGRTYTPHILFCGVDGTLNILLDFNVVCDSYEKALSMSIDRAIKMLSGNESTNN